MMTGASISYPTLEAATAGARTSDALDLSLRPRRSHRHTAAAAAAAAPPPPPPAECFPWSDSPPIGSSWVVRDCAAGRVRCLRYASSLRKRCDGCIGRPRPTPPPHWPLLPALRSPCRLQDHCLIHDCPSVTTAGEKTHTNKKRSEGSNQNENETKGSLPWLTLPFLSLVELDEGFAPSRTGLSLAFLLRGASPRRPFPSSLKFPFGDECGNATVSLEGRVFLKFAPTDGQVAWLRGYTLLLYTQYTAAAVKSQSAPKP